MEPEGLIADLLDKGSPNRQHAVWEARNIYAVALARATAAQRPPFPPDIDGFRYCEGEYNRCLGVPVRAFMPTGTGWPVK